MNDINSFASQYQVGADVDYQTFFRTKLNQVMSETFTAPTPQSVFQIAPLTQSRSFGPAHPWDFKYQGGTSPLPLSPTKSLEVNQSFAHTMPDSTSQPYWKRACAEPKPRPIVSISPFENNSSNNSSNLIDISSYDEKVIPTISKIIAHPKSKQLLDSYKKNQLPLRLGYISNKFFLNSLKVFQIPLKKSEVNALLKDFRAIGLPDTFSYNEFLQVCNYVKDHPR